MTDEIKREGTENADGSKSVNMSFSVDADNMREVNDQAVEVLDQALQELGANLLRLVEQPFGRHQSARTHLPARMMDFPSGGSAAIR